MMSIAGLLKRWLCFPQSCSAGLQLAQESTDMFKTNLLQTKIQHSKTARIPVISEVIYWAQDFDARRYVLSESSFSELFLPNFTLKAVYDLVLK